MRSSHWMMIPCFGLAVSACSEPPPPSQPPVPSTSKTAALPAPALPQRAVTLEEATQLIYGLAEAERRGNCEAVETYFSSRFVAVQGDLNAQEQFDKGAWLGWLRPLCSSPSSLEIHHIEWRDTDSRFTADGPRGSKYQFSEDRSDVYENIIERTLLLGWEGDQVRILGEEAIKPLNQLPIEQAAVRLKQFRFVIHGASRGGKAPIYLLAGRLRDGLPHENRERRKLHSGREIGTAPLAPAQRPESLSRWLGRRFLLFDAERERCRATVRRVGSIAPVYLAMGTDGGGARTEWDVLNNEAWLTFELDVDGGANCQAAFWAREEGAVQPLLIPGRPTPMPHDLETLQRRSLGWRQTSYGFLLQTLKTHSETLGKRMEQQVPDAGQKVEPGWDLWDHVRATVTRFAGIPGGDAYVVDVRSAYPSGRCKAGRCTETIGKPSTFAWTGDTQSVWQSREGVFKPIHYQGGYDAILFAADLEGDGIIAFVWKSHLARLRDGKLVQDGLSHWVD